MNEVNIIDSLSKKLNLDYFEAKKQLQVILDCIAEELKKGGFVKLVDFGLFEVVQRAPRKGYQPFYKREIIIPACNEPIFRAGKALKELINSTKESEVKING